MLVRKLRAAGMRAAGRASAAPWRIAAVARAGCLLLALRPHRAAAGRPARRRAAPARRDHARTRSQIFPDFDDDVEFVFDEVISEGGSPSQGTGTGDLEQLVILSPTERSPEGALAAQPDHGAAREGWQPRPGVPGGASARGHRPPAATASTSGARGHVQHRRAAPRRRRSTGTRGGLDHRPPRAGALVEAMLLPDSLPYRGLADSSGHFSLGPAPAGRVPRERRAGREPEPSRRPARGVRQRARRRAGDDSALRALGVRARHDPAADPHGHPRATASRPASSSPSRSIRASGSSRPRCGVSLLPDSTPVRVASMLPKPLDDSLHARRPAEAGHRRGGHHRRADTTPAPADRAHGRAGARAEPTPAHRPPAAHQPAGAPAGGALAARADATR